MADLNLTPLLRKSLAPYPRKIGRFHSSELFQIYKGYITPEKWIHPKYFSLAALMGMWNGMVVHDYVQNLLPSEGNEIKKVYDNGTIQLVAKADHIPNQVEEVWEFKTSKKLNKSATKANLYQLKLYLTMHEKPIGRIYQPVQNENGLFLKEIGVVERDDVWFMEQIEMLEVFHKKVVELLNEKHGGILPSINESI